MGTTVGVVPSRPTSLARPLPDLPRPGQPFPGQPRLIILLGDAIGPCLLGQGPVFRNACALAVAASCFGLVIRVWATPRTGLERGFDHTCRFFRAPLRAVDESDHFEQAHPRLRDDVVRHELP